MFEGNPKDSFKSAPYIVQSKKSVFASGNELTRRASFGVPVSGDSMEPRYHNGDILVVEGAEEIDLGEGDINYVVLLFCFHW